MTVYELIGRLAEHPADAEIQFDVGNFTGYDCDLKTNHLFYGGKNHAELHITLE